jgi:hypothetical protein
LAARCFQGTRIDEAITRVSITGRWCALVYVIDQPVTRVEWLKNSV